MSTTPDFSAIAEQFIVKQSVIENLFEEYELEAEAFGLEISFHEYLIEEFAQAAYMLAAMEGNEAVECLEAYDELYSTFDD